MLRNLLTSVSVARSGAWRVMRTMLPVMLCNASCPPFAPVSFVNLSRPSQCAAWLRKRAGCLSYGRRGSATGCFFCASQLPDAETSMHMNGDSPIAEEPMSNVAASHNCYTRMCASWDSNCSCAGAKAVVGANHVEFLLGLRWKNIARMVARALGDRKVCLIDVVSKQSLPKLMKSILVID